jgi:hypothetical protein
MYFKLFYTPRRPKAGGQQSTFENTSFDYYQFSKTRLVPVFSGIAADFTTSRAKRNN